MTNVGKPRIPQMTLKSNTFKVAEFALSKNLNTFPVTLSYNDVAPVFWLLLAQT